MTSARPVTVPARRRSLADTRKRLQHTEDQLRQLTVRLQAAREEERKTLARELHDELGQTLTAIKLELARAVTSFRRDQLSTGSVDRLQSLIGLTEIGIATVKRIATDLRPATLDHLGLAAALEWEATAFRARTGIRCRVVAGTITTLQPEQEVVLFRIFQESLTNVVRHAQASAVQVRLREESRGVELTVRDNGCGIPRARARDPQAIGLLGMRERAALIGGSFDVSGSPGKGSVVRVWVSRPVAGGALPRKRAKKRGDR